MAYDEGKPVEALQQSPSTDQILSEQLSAIHSNPGNEEAWRSLGQMLLRCNLPEAARTALKLSLELTIQEKVASQYSPFFRHTVPVRLINNRLALLETLCHDKKVLHIGCNDYPVFDPSTNLHIRLNQWCKQLDGLDTDEAGLKELSLHVAGKFYSAPSQVAEAYDVLLIPETIEHVDNIKLFLESLSDINFGLCFISAPNAFTPNDNGNYWADAKDYVEFVHPDHNCWFSPVTLSACIRKFTDWEVEEIVLLENRSMVGCLCRKPERGT